MPEQLAPEPVPPVSEVPSLDGIQERLRRSRRIHWLDQQIGDEDGDSDSDNDTNLIKDLKRERAGLLADEARVPWRKRRVHFACQDGCAHFQGHP